VSDILDLTLIESKSPWYLMYCALFWNSELVFCGCLTFPLQKLKCVVKLIEIWGRFVQDEFASKVAPMDNCSLLRSPLGVAAFYSLEESPLGSLSALFIGALQIHTFLYTYIRTWIHTYIHAYVHAEAFKLMFWTTEQIGGIIFALGRRCSSEGRKDKRFEKVGLGGFRTDQRFCH
jgi:hypothetical protein